jgi:hypothetical protein
VSETGYCFTKLGISSEDLQGLVMLRLDLLRLDLTVQDGGGKANPKLGVKLP